jgi:hypothetical protein
MATALRFKNDFKRNGRQYMISIIFPHALNKENDAVLQLKLQMLEDNATYPYEVLMLANNKRADLVYEGWDWLMRRAKYDLVLWDNSDIVYAPKFMDNVIKHADDADWIGLELVECGALDVAATNIHMNFGMTAAEFDREGFENWVEEYSKSRPSIRPGFCWYSPSVWKKQWYIDMGGFDLSKSFPHPIDSEFRAKCEANGSTFAVANSFAYHFQRARENSGIIQPHLNRQ